MFERLREDVREIIKMLAVIKVPKVSKSTVCIYAYIFSPQISVSSLRGLLEGKSCVLATVSNGA